MPDVQALWLARGSASIEMLTLLDAELEYDDLAIVDGQNVERD